MDNSYWFTLADLTIKLIFKEGGLNNISLLPSFAPFSTPHHTDRPLFQLIIDDGLQPVPKEQRTRIHTFDTGNGDIIVDRCSNGGHQFIIKDIQKKSCCLLVTKHDFTECSCALNGNYDMRSYGLNNALMLAYAFAACKEHTLLIHASLVRQHGYGYAFIAKSGTGKSTQVSMWLRYLPGCDLMNDDNPIIRVINGTPYIYGSPWSGKTPCYRNVKARLGAITQIDRAPQNSVDRLSPIDALVHFLPSCSSIKWEPALYDQFMATVTQVIETTGFYMLHCRPDREAAVVCHQAIVKVGK